MVLGASGSIGRQTLDVIRKSADSEKKLELVGFSIHSNSIAAAKLKREFPQAKGAWTGYTSIAPKEMDWNGIDAISHLLSETEAEIVVNGIAGASGLSASILALQNGKNLALANKESIVMGYRLLKSIAQENRCQIIPVDSEHAGIFQIVQRFGKSIVSELIITASGGPFYSLPLELLDTVTADEACKHPIWQMGRKISIDSATMANKGLELIEASRLFDMPQEQIKVLIHPQSYVHAMVRTIEGAIYAQISRPDMRLPIQMALYWPESVQASFGFADLAGMSLDFYEPTRDRYPMLWIARQAIDEGEAQCIVFNAANEIAVECFDNGKIRLTDIASLVAKVLDRDWNLPIESFEDIFDIDIKARKIAAHLSENIG
ncbi:MAG TPA: 1-deoxy-D-xylulose-5-phosphate reductoisomerase [Rectinema sp.]|nr:1-deoxy-D-xylulose-5-phosphate reductoisomerase [Rectinema sp.]